MRGDCAAFASHWHEHNYLVLAETGPLWVVLCDSTAQGLGAPSPDGGYVGQVLAELRLRTGLPWRVLNLSVSGALIRDVLDGQLPRLPAAPDLVTCGIGVNDVLYTTPAKLLRDLRTLAGAIPDGTVILDLPLPTGFWGSSAGSACPTWRGSTGPSTRRPGPAACRSRRSPPISRRPGAGSSHPTAFIPARRLPGLDPRAAGGHPAGGWPGGLRPRRRLNAPGGLRAAAAPRSPHRPGGSPRAPARSMSRSPASPGCGRHR
jgi:GDSL-like Lipase/Acylhydrolase family